MPEFDTSDFTLVGPAEDGSFILAFTRCRPRASPTAGGPPHNARRISLIILHAIASRKSVPIQSDLAYNAVRRADLRHLDKEGWYPAIERLFHLQSSRPQNDFYIEEVWTMDSPNHGRAAVLTSSRMHEMPNGLCGRTFSLSLL